MSNALGRLPIPQKMNSFEAEVGCDQSFTAIGKAQNRAIVPDTQFHFPVVEAQLAAKIGDESAFWKRHLEGFSHRLRHKPLQQYLMAPRAARFACAMRSSAHVGFSAISPKLRDQIVRPRQVGRRKPEFQNPITGVPGHFAGRWFQAFGKG
jgi:hypothetical protein